MSEHDAGPELDRLIAERVMVNRPNADGSITTIGVITTGSWSPSTNIAHAWEVVDRMIALGWILNLVGEHDSPRDHGPVPWCVQWASPALGDARRSYADTAPLAICRAALKACS